MFRCQGLDDEVGVVDPLFVGGLGGGHEVGVDFGSAFGSGAADDLAHHDECAGGQFSAVVMGRNIGIAHEVQKPVELLHTTSLKPGHVGMFRDLGVGDDAAEADANSALHRFIFGRLCDQGVGVDPGKWGLALTLDT